MLVTQGQTKIENLLGTYFTKIAVGTNAADPALTDTTITNPVIKTVTSIDFTTPGYVTFNTTLAADDPAMTINEVGLMNDAGELCYRDVVSSTVKATGAVLAIQFKIKVQ